MDSPPRLPQMDGDVSPTRRSKPKYTGKVRLCTARYSYNPYDGPNEHPEAELPLVAGKYLYVYGSMDDDGFYEGELLDGQRGLVPSNFVEFVQDKDKTASSQVADGDKESGYLNHADAGLQAADGGTDGDGRFNSTGAAPTGASPEGTGAEDAGVDEDGEEIVPYPRKITLIKQLAKSVIVAWEPPLVPPGRGPISAYNVLVDKEVRTSVPFGSATKALLEKLNLAACTYRISVQCVMERGVSDELRCTLLVGKSVVVAPYCLRVDDITQVSALLSWMPSNSNYSHAVFLNGAEHHVVRPASYRYRFSDLQPMTVYKVTAVAQPHQMPWQLPLEQREKREMSLEFCTQAAGPPFPPLNVQVHCGPAPGVLQVHWTPPALTATGTSNGASVIGYAVCTKGQRIAEVLYPMADYVTVELNQLQCLEAREVIVRTLSTQGESQDSVVASIPSNLLVPPHPHPHPQPHLPPHPHHPTPKPAASAGEPETKEQESGVRPPTQPWDTARSPSPLPAPHGHTLDAPRFPGRRSPSPQRILPQPRGTPIPDTVAKAIAREAAQRVAAETSRERSNTVHPVHALNSDEEEEEEEEEGYESAHTRRGASVDEFLRGSELGRQLQYSHSEEYQTESSRGSDLSDIMEEDEEELYSEMQLEEGRRRSVGPHGALKVLGNTSAARRDRHHRDSGRGPPQRRPVMVPSIDGYGGRERPSPQYLDESEPEDLCRIFVALFDYDPLSMSPNPDAADEELPFKEGQIIRVFGDKDTDGFYRGEIGGRSGLIPCNMVSEIQAEDEETMDQLIKQGFLSLNTPVDKIDRNRRGVPQPPVSRRRMVALYDYDPRESSPNVDVEAELTFCAGDIVAIFGEIDEDGFYYGELNGHRGLVPSNFLEEVPADVEVYLTDTPSQSQGAPGGTEPQRVPTETAGQPRRSASPLNLGPQTQEPKPATPAGAVGPQIPPGPLITPSPQITPAPDSPIRALSSPARGPRELSSKKKKGLLSKGRNLLKKLAVVK
ncbi:RIMS-binding protein 2-like [Megalops cyprinoides]|uniref:RIMS-binding protein 2-like n=1 Tax=Megalops cyprinoides TaxID=118141 RepID=UPI001864C7A1|nr:RIMS-binding protein 2-like [Megalops cyprinoides]XP_036385268.1 RIMS-binding protein 2-like [Megalops cyprinoides]XP_036385269.1 RIMS-binding protein 2-like [Megalops cyprinoides]